MIVKYNKTATAASGSISFNTDDIRGICYRIFIKPATASTTYNLTSITDDNGLIIFSKKGIRGTLNVTTPQTLKGIYTIAVDNASKDELFTVQIELQEIGG